MPDGRGPVRHSVFKAPFVDSRQNGLIEQELKTLSASPLSHIEMWDPADRPKGTPRTARLCVGDRAAAGRDHSGLVELAIRPSPPLQAFPVGLPRHHAVIEPMLHRVTYRRRQTWERQPLFIGVRRVRLDPRAGRLEL